MARIVAVNDGTGGLATALFSRRPGREISAVDRNPEGRRIQPDDAQQLQPSFRCLPEDDRMFVKEDVLDPDSAAAWAGDQPGQRFVAANAIIGYVAIVPGARWKAHIRDIRRMFGCGKRRAAVRRDLARHALIGAVENELRRTLVEVMANERAPVAMFEALGFEQETLLREHVYPSGDELHDLVVRAHHMGNTSAELITAGVADESG